MSPARSQTAAAPPAEESVDDPGERLVDAFPQPNAVRAGGARTVTALLPDGRTVWLHLGAATSTTGAPASPPALDAVVRRLARTTAVTQARTATASRATSRAIERLARAVSADAQRIAGERLRADRALLRAIAAGDARVDRAISRAGARAETAARREIRGLRRTADKARRRDLWDSLVVLSSLPLFAAYGQRGDPLALNNFTLAISLAVWLAGDEVSDWLTGEKSIPGGVLRDVDVWSYAAPFANVLTGVWLLRGGQHERFVTGIASSFDLALVGVSPNNADRYDVYVAAIDLTEGAVRPDYAADFASYTGVPVLTTLRAATSDPGAGDVEIGPVIAEVNSGVLRLELTATAANLSSPLTTVDRLLTSIEVAWIVDTQKPSS